MATKPASLPQWNSGGANNVAPSGAKKILGWITNEVAPSATFNWWQKLVYEWTAYLDDLEAQVFTWAAAHIFNAGIYVEDDGANPAIHGSAANGGGAGVYGDGGAGDDGVLGVGGTTGLGYGGRFLRGDANTDDDAVLVGGYVFLSGDDPAGTDPLINQLTPMSFAKAFGRVTTDGAGNVAVTGALNCAAVSLPGGNLVRFTIAGDMANANFVAITISGLGGSQAFPVNRNVGYLEFQIWAEDVGGVLGVVNPAAIATIVNVVILGAQ